MSLQLKAETKSSSFQKFITVSVSPVQSVLPLCINATDVTVTETVIRTSISSQKLITVSVSPVESVLP